MHTMFEEIFTSSSRFSYSNLYEIHTSVPQSSGWGTEVWITISFYTCVSLTLPLTLLTSLPFIFLFLHLFISLFYISIHLFFLSLPCLPSLVSFSHLYPFSLTHLSFFISFFLCHSPLSFLVLFFPSWSFSLNSLCLISYHWCLKRLHIEADRTQWQVCHVDKSWMKSWKGDERHFGWLLTSSQSSNAKLKQ